MKVPAVRLLLLWVISMIYWVAQNRGAEALHDDTQLMGLASMWFKDK